MAFFDEAESRRIAETVARVEKATSGEIVVATVDRSASHTAPRLVFAIAAGAAATLVTAAVFPHLGIDGVLLVQVLAGIAGYAIAGIPAVLRLLVGRAGLDAAAQAHALRAFADHGVFDTRDRTGVLVFLSALEHRAVILGDKGIRARMGDGGFDALVGELTAALHDDHGADGVCKVVEAIGEALARDLPPAPDDANELPDAPVHLPDGH